jgi:hypothetical protein
MLGGLGVRLMTSPRKYLQLRNHGGGQDPYRVVAPEEKRKSRMDIECFVGENNMVTNFVYYNYNEVLSVV